MKSNSTYTAIKPITTIVLQFSIPGNTTRVHCYSNGIASNRNCTINIAIHLCYRVISFISQAVCLSDNTTHVYFFRFSAPAERFCSSDNTTHVYFCKVCLLVKTICSSDNATCVYFCNFCL
jgi:hypothetical protein